MKFSKWAPSIAEVGRELAQVAQGRIPADLVFKNAKLINVNTAELQDGIDVAVYQGRIALVGNASHCVGEETEVVDAGGYYLSPGFLDGHIHVESSMVTAGEYARAVVPNGTVGIFMDPHEIANVLGMDGVKMMHRDGQAAGMKVFTTIPSCVPAAPGFEDAGAEIGPEDISRGMEWEGVPALGEMMNFPGVLNGDEKVYGEIRATLKAGRVVTGHYSLPEIDKGLPGFIAAGISSCHESVRKEDALAKMRLGCYAMLREGSAWHDVKETIKAVTETGIDSRFCMLVTDDTHPETLLTKGHLNYVVSRAIEEGVNPLQAIQMVTINTAQYFQAAADLGSISPGKCADILLISDLSRVKVDRVYIDGRLVAESGEFLYTSEYLPREFYPEKARNTVHLQEITAEDFKAAAPEAAQDQVQVRAIEVIESQVGTLHREITLPVKDGNVDLFPRGNVAKAAVFERHSGNGGKAIGFVTGFGFTGGAVASTVAHDSHNLLVVGMNDQDMSAAANTLIAGGGGMTAVKDGRVLAYVPLPIAGLISDAPVEEVREQVKQLEEAWRLLGCQLDSPFMTMALLALPVLPELRLTNRGLVDTVNFKFVDLFV